MSRHTAEHKLYNTTDKIGSFIVRPPFNKSSEVSGHVYTLSVRVSSYLKIYLSFFHTYMDSFSLVVARTRLF